MISRGRLKQKYDIIHEHFNFKDLIGLSALMFGLLLSTPTNKTNTANAEEVVPTGKIEKPAPIKKRKKISKKKVLLKHPKKQRVAAALKKKN